MWVSSERVSTAGAPERLVQLLAGDQLAGVAEQVLGDGVFRPGATRWAPNSTWRPSGSKR
jgi:hypothetical protein